MLVDGVQALVRVRRSCTVSGVGGGMSPGGLSVLGGLFSLFSPCLHCYHPVYFSAHFPALMLLLAHPHASSLSWDALLCLLGHILL